MFVGVCVCRIAFMPSGTVITHRQPQKERAEKRERDMGRKDAGDKKKVPGWAGSNSVDRWKC